MTKRERDILRALIDLLAGDRPVVATEAVKLLEKAQELLDVTTDPEPEHPAVRTYREWCSSLKLNEMTYSQSEAFLAGWVRALRWASEQPYFEHKSGGTGETVLLDYALATPTQLP